VHSVTSQSLAETLTLQIDESGMSPTRNDIILVYATINDHNNNIVHHDNREVTFAVQGARLIGPASVKAQAGIATILVRTGFSSSDITITASAPGLNPNTTYIQIL
jgi:beta-galactosidase